MNVMVIAPQPNVSSSGCGDTTSTLIFFPHSYIIYSSLSIQTGSISNISIKLSPVLIVIKNKIIVNEN